MTSNDHKQVTFEGRVVVDANKLLKCGTVISDMAKIRNRKWNIGVKTNNEPKRQS